MEIIKSLENDVNRLTELREYYKAMHEKTKGRKDLFVFVVNPAYTMNYANGVAVMGSYSQTSVITENVADQIAAKGDFKTSKGDKVEPIGKVLAEDFFAQQVDDVLETLGIIEKSLIALREKTK